MKKFPTTALGLVLCLTLPAGLAAASAAKPCGGISIDDGVVATARPLKASEKLEGEAAACRDAVAAALAGVPSLRTVTVGVKLHDSQRVGGKALRIAKVYADAIAAAGVRKSRISTVAPPARHGEEGKVTIVFTEKRSRRSVAVVEAASGSVQAGRRRDALKAARRGETYPPGTYVATGGDGAASVLLADGSRIKLALDTTVLIGDLYLNEKLKRVVKLDLLQGQVDADVRSGGDGSTFEMATRTGVAGVRGTSFRLTHRPSEGTKIETLEGEVAMSIEGADEPILVAGGEGLATDTQGATSSSGSLLSSPMPERPLKGTLDSAGTLQWVAVDGASGYRVDVARDAEFAYDSRRYEAEAGTLTAPSDLPAGKWFWRVSAVDDKGFVGSASKVYSFVYEP